MHESHICTMFQNQNKNNLIFWPTKEMIQYEIHMNTKIGVLLNHYCLVVHMKTLSFKMFIGITHEIFELVTNKKLYEIFGEIVL